MNLFLVKLQNDRIFREGTFPEMRSEYVADIAAVPVARKRPDVLVLGAFGCGVFGNRRETVYPQFERAINRYLPDGVEVVFADPHPPQA